MPIFPGLLRNSVILCRPSHRAARVTEFFAVNFLWCQPGRQAILRQSLQPLLQPLLQLRINPRLEIKSPNEAARLWHAPRAKRKKVGRGFEPLRPLRAYPISSRIRSTALPPHQGAGEYYSPNQLCRSQGANSSPSKQKTSNHGAACHGCGEHQPHMQAPLDFSNRLIAVAHSIKQANKRVRVSPLTAG